MSYSTSTLTSVAQCDAALSMAADKKSDLEFIVTSLNKHSTDTLKNTARNQAALILVNAQIAGITTGIAGITDEAALKKMNSNLRKLNDRRENLEESIENGTGGSVMENELSLSLALKQLAEIEVFIAEVTARKAAL